MSKVLTLKECCEFQEGYVNPSQKNPRYFGGNIKWLRASDLNGGYVFSTERTLSDEGYASAGKSAKMFAKDTIAISKSGTIGALGILKDEMCGNRAVINISVRNEKADLMYVFYTLKYKKEELESKAGGSIQKNLYVSALETLGLNHSEKVEQAKISQVLAAIDSKIELNNRINAELEAMAKTLYDYWFVQFDFPFDFEQGKPAANGKPYKSSGGKMIYNPTLKREIPEGWEWKPIEKLIDVRDGTHDSPKPSESGQYLITSKHLKDSGIDFSDAYLISDEDFEAVNKRSKVDEGDFLLSMIGTIGLSHWVMKIETPFAIKNIGLFKTSQSPDWADYIFSSVTSDVGKFYLKQNQSTGTSQPYVTLGTLRNIPIIIPPDEIFQSFTEKVRPLHKAINVNIWESQKLSQLRDWLLPMLMNGQVTV